MDYGYGYSTPPDPSLYPAAGGMSSNSPAIVYPGYLHRHYTLMLLLASDLAYIVITLPPLGHLRNITTLPIN